MRVDFNITDLSEWGSQSYFCRVGYRGKYKRKNFSFVRYGGKEKALEAATRWRDQVNKKLGAPAKRTGYTKHRRYLIRSDKCGVNQDLPVGVTRYYKCGSHYADGVDRLFFVVNWSDHWSEDWPKNEMVRPRSTSFWVGPVNDIYPEVLREGIRCACEFRKAYETALKRGKHFDECKTKKRLRRRLERIRRQLEQ